MLPTHLINEYPRAMNKLVHYSVQDNIATIRIDDGKRNALSPAVLRELHQALDQAESDVTRRSSYE